MKLDDEDDDDDDDDDDAGRGGGGGGDFIPVGTCYRHTYFYTWTIVHDNHSHCDSPLAIST